MRITIDDFRAAQSLIIRRSQELKKSNGMSLSEASNQSYSELADALSMPTESLKSQMAKVRGSFYRKSKRNHRHHHDDKRHYTRHIKPEIVVEAEKVLPDEKPATWDTFDANEGQIQQGQPVGYKESDDDMKSADELMKGLLSTAEMLNWTSRLIVDTAEQLKQEIARRWPIKK